MMFTSFLLALMLAVASAKLRRIRNNYEFGRRVRAAPNNALPNSTRRKMVQLFLSDTDTRLNKQDSFFRSLKDGDASLSYSYHYDASPHHGNGGQGAPPPIPGDAYSQDSSRNIVPKTIIAQSGETVPLDDGTKSGLLLTSSSSVVLPPGSATIGRDESAPSTNSVEVEAVGEVINSLVNSAVEGRSSLPTDEGSSVPPVVKTTSGEDKTSSSVRAGSPIRLSENNQGAISTDESSSSTADKTFASAAQAPGHDSALIASIIAAVAAATILLTVVGFVGYQHFGKPTSST
jgi:hypothetical protein